MNIEEARAIVAAAETQEKDSQRAMLIQQLATVRDQLRVARAEHAVLVKRIHAEREARDNANRRVASVIQALGESLKARPAAADYLGDEDVEVAAWRKRHTELEAKRDRLIAERDALPDPEATIVQANKFEGSIGLISTLSFAESNLLRALEGKSGITRFEGGVFGVR